METRKYELNCLLVGSKLEIDDKDIHLQDLLEEYKTEKDLSEMQYLPTIVDDFYLKKHISGVDIFYRVLAQNPSMEQYARLRMLAYPNKQVFIIPCTPSSLDNLKKIWLPELTSASPNSLIYLVGIPDLPATSIKELEENFKLHYVSCPDYHQASIKKAFDYILEEAAIKLYPHLDRTGPFLFFKKYFTSKEAGLRFAAGIPWLARGNLPIQLNNDKPCYLPLLPMELMLEIVIEAGNFILRDPADKDSQKALAALCRLVFDNALSAKASTGKKMQWHRLFTYESGENYAIYPDNNKKHSRCSMM